MNSKVYEALVSLGYAEGDLIEGLCDSGMTYRLEHGRLMCKSCTGSWAESCFDDTDVAILRTAGKISPKQNNTQITLDGIRIIVNGKAVVMIDSNGNKGLARCNPSDEFDLGKGLALALTRLIEKRGGKQ